jgi:hypothetical protein
METQSTADLTSNKMLLRAALAFRRELFGKSPVGVRQGERVLKFSWEKMRFLPWTQHHKGTQGPHPERLHVTVVSTFSSTWVLGRLPEQT